MTGTGVRTDLAELKGFDTFVERTMRDWKVNGLSIAIARGGEIVHARGYGVRDVESGAPMTEHTLTPIASITKTFTAMSVALLVDEGLISWDTPVRHYLPDFALRDEVASARITPRDLLSHRSGLPRHDLLWYGGAGTRPELVRRLRYLEPTADLRTVWQYQNLMFMTAGYLVEQVSGERWEEFVRRRILERLGMMSSAFSIDVMRRSADFSTGYRRSKGKAVPMAFYEEQEALGPAGAIVSSATDLSRWLLLHLNGGVVQGERLVSEAQIREMHAPQMSIDLPGRFPEMPRQSYGLGWFLEPYRGRSVIHHGGNIDGFSTLLTLMPDEGIGVALQTNMNGSAIRDFIPLNVYDRLLGLDEIPWNERFVQDFEATEAAGKTGKARTRSTRVRGTRPSHPVASYAGIYRHPAYGDITVRLEDGKLRASYNLFDMALAHHHFETFRGAVPEREIEMSLTFTTDARGRIASLAAPLEPTASDIIFDRVTGDIPERERLSACAGTYDYQGYPLDVTMKADGLRIAVPGFPPYDLVPVGGLSFNFKGPSTFSATFEGEDERGSSLTLTLGDTVFVLPRR